MLPNNIIITEFFERAIIFYCSRNNKILREIYLNAEVKWGEIRKWSGMGWVTLVKNIPMLEYFYPDFLCLPKTFSLWKGWYAPFFIFHYSLLLDVKRGPRVLINIVYLFIKYKLFELSNVYVLCRKILVALF